MRDIANQVIPPVVQTRKRPAMRRRTLQNGQTMSWSTLIAVPALFWLCQESHHPSMFAEGFGSLRPSPLSYRHQQRYPSTNNKPTTKQTKDFSSTKSLDASTARITPGITKDTPILDVDSLIQPTPLANSGFLTKKRSVPEMVGLSVLGGSLALGIIYTLASSIGTQQMLRRSGGSLALAQESLGEVGLRLLDVALPTSATDVVTGAFGEATAGIVAAFSSFCLSLILSNTIAWYEKMEGQPEENTSAALSLTAGDKEKDLQKKRLVSRDLTRKAVANGDFFVARATAAPLLECLGIPTFVSLLGGALFAIVPAEIVSIAAQKKIEKERRKLEMMLDEEEQVRMELEKPFPLNVLFPAPAAAVSLAVRQRLQSNGDSAVRQRLKNPDASACKLLKKETSDGANVETIAVDVMADMIKWLGYGALHNDFAGRMMYNGLPLFPGFESAWFGVIAALSAQIYADVFFAVFGFGGESKRNEVRSRSLLKWLVLYFQETISSAALFGVYEFAQIPAKAVVSAILSGGADNCFGSKDYNLCVEAYLVNNPPGASPVAQLRSLATTLFSVWNRYAPDGFDALSFDSFF